MPIVTLTSDFGLQDYYVPIIKGAILTQNEQLRIVDISNNIKNYDIVQAAFVLSNAYHHFPLGTIHIITVNNAEQGVERLLIMRRDGHYFVSPDNGIFSLMFEQITDPIYAIKHKLNSTFAYGKSIASIVGHLSNGTPIEELGEQVDDIVQRISLQPVISQSQIRGSVIHVDNYENVITNITKDLFSRLQQGRSFNIQFKRHDSISQIHTHYSQVPVGDILCLFNSSDYLEIAINMGMASSMLGLYVEEMVQIDFTKT